MSRACPCPINFNSHALNWCVTLSTSFSLLCTAARNSPISRSRSSNVSKHRLSRLPESSLNRLMLPSAFDLNSSNFFVTLDHRKYEYANKRKKITANGFTVPSEPFLKCLNAPFHPKAPSVLRTNPKPVRPRRLFFPPPSSSESSSNKLYLCCGDRYGWCCCWW